MGTSPQGLLDRVNAIFERSKGTLGGVQEGLIGAAGEAGLFGQEPRPGEQRTVVIPGTNKIVLQQWDETEQIWETVGSGTAPTGTTGGAGSSFRPGELDLLNRQLAEDERHNRATEANIQRQRALEAASEAMSAFLRATEAADARRLAAFDVSTALLPSLVDPSQEFFGGGPGGALATASSRFGLPFTPTRIQHKQFVPASLALPPELDPGVMGRIGGIPRG